MLPCGGLPEGRLCQSSTMCALRKAMDVLGRQFPGDAPRRYSAFIIPFFMLLLVQPLLSSGSFHDPKIHTSSVLFVPGCHSSTKPSFHYGETDESPFDAYLMTMKRKVIERNEKNPPTFDRFFF